MEDFLNKLYSYENFSLYLIIAIVVLVILFIIILLFGKKDKKEREIEATKKLEQLNVDNGFKETTEEVRVEVTPKENVLNEDTIVIPTISELPKEEIVTEEPKVETEEPVVEEIKPIEETKEDLEKTVVNLPNIENDNDISINTLERPEINVNEDVYVSPILNEEVETPLFVNEEVKEEIKMPEFNEPEIPVFNFDNAMNDVENVYEVPNIEEVKEDTNKEIFSSVFVPENKDNEEEEIELPTLKKEVKKEEVGELKDFHLDDITGEIYKINK